MTRTAGPPAPPTPLIDHRQGIALAEVAYDRFAGGVETLSGTDWEQPTDCAGWTVRDLVGHMVGAMRSAASLRELASQQREVKARLRAQGGSETDHMTAIQVERTAALSTAELARECRALVPLATAGRRRTPTVARRLMRFPVTVGDATETWTLGYLVDVILTRDAWLHRVDLCRAVGADLELTGDHDGVVVADVVAEWARRHGRPYELVLGGPAGGRFGAGTPAEHLELDAVEFCRTVSGRAPGQGLLAVAVPF